LADLAFLGAGTDISTIHGPIAAMPITDISKFFYLVFGFFTKNKYSTFFSKTSKIRIYELKIFNLQQFQYFAMIFN